MKKSVLIAAVFLGGIAASQAGVDFHIGIDLFPHPERVVISRPCPPPVVVAAPAPVCAPAPVVVAPPVCEVPPPAYHTRVVYQAPVVCEPRPVYYSRGYDYRSRSHYDRRDYAYEGRHYGYDHGRDYGHDRRH